MGVLTQIWAGFTAETIAVDSFTHKLRKFIILLNLTRSPHIEAAPFTLKMAF